MPLRGGRIWLGEGQIRSATKGIQRVQLFHTLSGSPAVFDEPSLASAEAAPPDGSVRGAFRCSR
jgi:hypothetical protein